jgi:hypothetical protein
MKTMIEKFDNIENISKIGMSEAVDDLIWL